MKDSYSPQSAGGLHPQEQLLGTPVSRNHLCIGLPKEESNGEKRFPLTPEGVAILVANGYRVRIESQAGNVINYSDYHYAEAGAEIVNTGEVYRCDLVLKTTPLSVQEAGFIRPGALLFTLLQPQYQSPEVLKILLQKRIIAIAYDLISNESHHYPFADMLAEVEGRASVVVASELMSNRSGGKGIVLGGISGVAPSEVVIIGAGLAGRAAAHSALAQGALVRLFDNDVYRLRLARQEIDYSLFTSNLHPHVLKNALHSADVVISTEVMPGGKLTEENVKEMKKGALLFDLCMDRGGCSETSLCSDRPCDRVYEKHGVLHYCLSSVGSTVARTAAMAMSNLFVSLFLEFGEQGGVQGRIESCEGFRRAVYLYGGRVVNHDLSVRCGFPYYDMSLFVSMF